MAKRKIKARTKPGNQLVLAVAHPETSPPVIWTGKMHSWTGWTGKKMGYLIVIFCHKFDLINWITYPFFVMMLLYYR